MQLIKYDPVKFQVTVSDEAFLVRPIRRLFQKDRTVEKENFFRMMSILYFVYDPRSTYAYIIDENSRLEEVLLQEGIDPDKFKIDKEFKEVIDIYRKLVETVSSKTFERTKNQIDKISKELDRIDYSRITEEDKKVTAIKNSAAIAKEIPSLLEQLAKAEKAMVQDIEEQSKARGNKNLTITDSGLTGLFQ